MKYYFLFFWTFIFYSFGQSKVGEWRAHLDYSKTNCLFYSENKFYVGSESQFFTYDQSDNSIESYSKLNGLNDHNVTSIYKDTNTKTIIIGYENGNIDLMRNNQVFNIPFIKNSNNIIGSKQINNIHVDLEIAYLACDFGLVLLDINNYEILDTYYFWNNGVSGSVNDCFVFNNSNKNSYLSNKIFVATDFGLFSADKNNPNLMNPNSWNNSYGVLNQSGISKSIFFSNGIKKLICKDDSEAELILIPNDHKSVGLEISSCEILILTNQSGDFESYQIPEICINGEEIISAHLEGDEIMGFSYSKLFYIENIADLKDKGLEKSKIEIFSISPLNLMNSFNNIVFNKNSSGNTIKIYFSDNINGLAQCVIYNGDFYFENYYLPNGPDANSFGDITFLENKLIVTHGGKNNSWNNLNINKEISIYENYLWSKSEEIIDAEIKDLLTIAGTANKFYVGSWNNGLIEFTNKNLSNIYNEKNSSLQTITSDGWIRIGGCCNDLNNNLWVTNSQSENPISLFSNDAWQNFSLNTISTNTMIGKILCSTNGQKWIQTRGEGVIVISNDGDQKNLLERKVTSSVNNGSLPSNTINSITEDLDGAIWVGTANGVGVFFFPNSIFSEKSIVCETPLVEVDGYVERLLYNTNVLDIKVDGGNRKWFATEGKGVFLMSESGVEEVFHFTSENSPLLSNVVNNIEIDPYTGEVYFGTSIGLCSFRSTATTPSENFENVLIFPNPVKKNYSGIITINGLGSNTNVKITDISGNLVYEVYSEGGTATWDGKSFSGKRVKTGVYLFFCSNESLTETIVKKILIYN